VQASNDKRLMLQVRSGDLDALGEIVLRYQAWAWRIAYRFLVESSLNNIV